MVIVFSGCFSLDFRYIIKVSPQFHGHAFVKAYPHVTSVFAFFFDICYPILQNVNVKCEHYHLLP